MASWTLVFTCIRFRSGMRISFCPSLTWAPCWIIPSWLLLKRLVDSL